MYEIFSCVNIFNTCSIKMIWPGENKIHKLCEYKGNHLSSVSSVAVHPVDNHTKIENAIQHHQYISLNSLNNERVVAFLILLASYITKLSNDIETNSATNFYDAFTKDIMHRFHNICKKYTPTIEEKERWRKERVHFARSLCQGIRNNIEQKSLETSRVASLLFVMTHTHLKSTNPGYKKCTKILLHKVVPSLVQSCKQSNRVEELQSSIQ